MNTVDQILSQALGATPRPWQDGIDPGLFIRRAKYHGVFTLLHESIKRYDTDLGWPLELRQQTEQHSRHAAANELLLQDELQKCLRALQDANVRALLAKGALLAYTLYPSPACRPRCDSDIFIPATQKERALQVLRNLGYARYNSTPGDMVNRQAIMTRDIGHGLTHCIDVHWHLFSRHTLTHVLPHHLCWQERVAVTELGATAHGLRPAHALLHACLHRLAHHYDDGDRLIWLYDLLLLSNTLNAREKSDFTTLCCDDGLADACVESLTACATLWRNPRTDELIDTLRTHRGTNEIPLRRIIATGQLGVLRQDLSALPTLGQKLRLVKQHLFPSQQYMKARYNVTSDLSLPWLYLKRMCNGAMKLNPARRSPR